MQVPDPTSAEGLQAAGVLQADALLLVAEEGCRANSTQADAQVRGWGAQAGAQVCGWGAQADAQVGFFLSKLYTRNFLELSGACMPAAAAAAAAAVINRCWAPWWSCNTCWPSLTTLYAHTAAN
jgi:hypothetical protein